MVLSKVKANLNREMAPGLNLMTNIHMNTL